jgi:hypothetical protein
LSKGRLTKGRLTKGFLSKGRLTKGRLTKGFLSNGRLTKGRLTKGSLSNGRLTKGRTPNPGRGSTLATLVLSLDDTLVGAAAEAVGAAEKAMDAAIGTTIPIARDFTLTVSSQCSRRQVRRVSLMIVGPSW